MFKSRCEWCSKRRGGGVDFTLDQIFGKDTFNMIINGDQLEGKGKPDPAPFKLALQSLSKTIAEPRRKTLDKSSREDLLLGFVSHVIWVA